MVDRGQIQDLLLVMSVESAIEIFLSRKTFSKKKTTTLLLDNARKTMSTEKKWHMFVLLTLLNNFIKPRGLCIKLSGEDGVDAGAIKNDFFLGYLQKIEFEGG